MSPVARAVCIQFSSSRSASSEFSLSESWRESTLAISAVYIIRLEDVGCKTMCVKKMQAKVVIYTLSQEKSTCRPGGIFFIGL